MAPTKTQAQIQKETEKLARVTAKIEGYRHHSAKRHYFKEQAQKIKGRLLVLHAQLNKEMRLANQGPHAAVKWALHQIGTSEQPPYSNLGPGITQWERNTGYKVPPGVFWCGCFASEAVVVHGKAKITNRNRCGYGPYVMSDAENHRNGFVAVTFNKVQPGDYLIFFGGEHQGIARSHAHGGYVDTVEGNTSPSSSGSQFNGGTVAAKSRSRADVSCVARPKYPKGA